MPSLGQQMLSAHGLLAYNRLKFRETDEDDNESVDALTRNGYAWLRLLTTRPGGLTTENDISVD